MLAYVASDVHGPPFTDTRGSTGSPTPLRGTPEARSFTMYQNTGTSDDHTRLKYRLTRVSMAKDDGSGIVAKLGTLPEMPITTLVLEISAEGRCVSMLPIKRDNVMIAVGDADVAFTARPRLVNTYLPGPHVVSFSGKYIVTPREIVEEIKRNCENMTPLNSLFVLSIIDCRGKPEDVRDSVCVFVRVRLDV